MATIKSQQQKITACLWFDKNAEEAAQFYTSVFKKSKVGAMSYYGEGAPMPKGTVLTVQFQLEGQKFLALNGGPMFKFTEAISFVVNCKTQNEIDYFWEELSRDGEKQQCGWLKDKYEVSWQVVPSTISTMMTAKDTKKSSRVMQALLKMNKLDIKILNEAFQGRK